MLYLEARCLSLVRAAGSQGVQNGSISCVALALSVPGGTREVLAENVLAAWLDLEVASGQRRDREPLGDPQDGEADGAVPARHRLRHLGLLVDAALRQHVRRRQLRLARPRRVADAAARLAGRRRDRAARRGRARSRCASAPRARCRRCSPSSASRRSPTRRCGSPPTCLDSRDLPDRDRAADVLAGDRVLDEGISGLDVARALDRRGFPDVAEAIFGMQRQRVAADYLQTSAIIAADGTVVSAVNDPNDYTGPGHRLPARGRALGAPAAAAVRGRRAAARRRRAGRRRPSSAVGPAEPGRSPDEVVVAVGPAFGDALSETINGLAHADVLDGDRRRRPRGGRRSPRLVRILRSADVAFIGHDGARLSGSRIAVGLQSKGTALIHRADLRAARQPRAVRHGAVADARLVPADRPQRGRLRARPCRSRRCRRCSTTTRGRS